jgi:hypothetical protein
MQKLLFSKLLFGSHNPPPIIHESTNMDSDKRAITMKKLHEDTSAIIHEHVLRQATRLNTKKKGRDKTLIMLSTQHHDNKMMRDIELQCIQRPICFQAKSISNPYTHAPTFDVITRVHHIDHCKPCYRTVNASHMHTLFLREKIRLHGLPTTIAKDQDMCFINFNGTTLKTKYIIHVKARMPRQGDEVTLESRTTLSQGGGEMM